MSELRVSQLNILLQTCTILVISCLLLKIIDGQDSEWPVIIDPFPDPDTIPPEPIPTPPPAPDCTQACQDRISTAMALINNLQTQLADTNTTLWQRVLILEASGGSGGSGTDPLVLLRLSNLETYLPANVSMLMEKIDGDLDVLRIQMRQEIANLRKDLELKIDSIPAGGGGGDGGKAMEVYLNLTSRINLLENGKIQGLMTDNNLWRQNFKVVNSTFARLKKSAFSNNVVVTG